MVCTTIPKEPSPPPPFEGDQQFACGCARAVWDVRHGCVTELWHVACLHGPSRESSSSMCTGAKTQADGCSPRPHLGLTA